MRTADKITPLELSAHAVTQLRQRGIPLAAVQAAWEHGFPEHHAGAVRYWLTARMLKDTPFEREAHRLHRFCVVVADDRIVTTVKRCRRWRRPD